MRIDLDYGRTGLAVEVPDRNLVGILRLKPQNPLADADRVLRDALVRPVRRPPLAAAARGKQSACVVISDITRPVPNKFLLPPILATLDLAGVPREAVTILVATGTHRPNEGDELVEMVGADIVRDYRIVNHVARDPDTHTYLGESPNGVPAHVDSRYLEAELKITLALIEPHFMAGYSGGRKSVCPGICSMETVKVWHGPRFIGHEKADTGILEGNPVHEEATWIANKAGLDFICDVTLNERRQITGIFAGDMEAAWLKGVRQVEDVVRAPLSQPADIVVTTCAGHPLDLTLYQAVKGMVGAMPAVKPGGTIIIASRCEEGIGSEDFTNILRSNPDLGAFVQQTYEPDFFIPDQWEAHELHKALSHAEVLCYTEGIEDDDLRQCGVTPIRSVEEGIGRALTKHGSLASIAVIPKGPYVVPYVDAPTPASAAA